MSAKAIALASVVRLLEGGPMYEHLLDQDEQRAVVHLIKAGLVRRTYHTIIGLAKVQLVEDPQP